MTTTLLILLLAVLLAEGCDRALDGFRDRAALRWIDELEERTPCRGDKEKGENGMICFLLSIVAGFLRALLKDLKHY